MATYMLMFLSHGRLELSCVQINLDSTLYNQEIIEEKFHGMNTEHLRGVTATKGTWP